MREHRPPGPIDVQEDFVHTNGPLLSTRTKEDVDRATLFILRHRRVITRITTTSLEE